MLRWTELDLGIVVGMLGSNGYLAKAAGAKDQRRKGENSRKKGTSFVFSEIVVKHIVIKLSWL